MRKIRTIKLKDYIDEGKNIFGDDKKEWIYRCPVCKTNQTFHDFVDAGVEKKEIDNYLGFSCVGRWTGAGPHNPKNKKQIGCNYTLGGLFTLQELEVKDDESNIHPRFDWGKKE